METLPSKLRPSRFPSMSPFMAAIVGYVLDESFTEPEIAEIAVSETENLVYIRQRGAPGFDSIQSLDDLRENWNRLMDAAGLTPEERTQAVELFRKKVEAVPAPGIMTDSAARVFSRGCRLRSQAPVRFS